MKLEKSEFWRQIPIWSKVTKEEFQSPLWQDRNSIAKPADILTVLDGLVDNNILLDIVDGFKLAPMSVRLPPYIFSMINWQKALTDPLRIQFIPMASDFEPDHPLMGIDSLCETRDAPVEGLVHRYRDKALLLALDTCPIYCRYCTRSYAVGLDTEQVQKANIGPRSSRWQLALEYLAAHPEVRDVVVSGGDVMRLKAKQITHLCAELLKIPSIRRIRLATKGLAVLPMKFTHDTDWCNAIIDSVHAARKKDVEICIHTHFNHPNEITEYTCNAARLLFKHNIKVRNQSVLLKGVNDDCATMAALIDMLSELHIQPYYVYLCDQVTGTEHLRVPLKTAIELEKQLRGWTAGYNTPLWVVDTAGGGGKRDIHSYETYSEETGIASYRSPTINPNEVFFHYDPLTALVPEIARLWHSDQWRETQILQHRHYEKASSQLLNKIVSYKPEAQELA